MSFLCDESITNFFRRVNSKEGAKKMRKRKRVEDDAEANQASNNKESKVQQRLAFSSGSQTRISKTPSLKRGESSKSRLATPPVDALSRVSFEETSFARHANALPTPLTAKRPAATRITRSFLDQPALTPRPASPPSISHSEQRRTTDLPTPVTMPRRAVYAKTSPPRRVRPPTPACELPSPEPSQASSFHLSSSEYGESMAVEEGQGDWGSLIPSQKVVPSSQSQADGCFDSTSLLVPDSEPSTPPRSPVFLAPRPPDKEPHGLSRIEDRGQTLTGQGRQPSSEPCSPVEDPLETSLIEVHDGEEYVLSSQSQLVLPFHVSPRKDRGRVSSVSSSIPDDTAHSDEIVPSSQSQFEKELDEMCDSDNLPHVLDNNPLEAESSCPEDTFSSPEEVSTSTQILVEETPENFYDLLPLNDHELGSATEEESGDEGNVMFPPNPSSSALTRFHESVPSSSQESLSYPSSLPDAVKEFREMFGVGDGSYPDDFPMSLRD